MSGEVDSDVELLTSPLRKGLVSRAFVIGGPLGLLLAICVSLWVSYLHVRHTVTVHCESQWVPGETLAIRAHIIAEHEGVQLEGAAVHAWVEQDAQRFDLGDLAPTPRDGLFQGAREVPNLAVGPAQLHLTFAGGDLQERHETIDIEVVERATSKEGTPTVAGSTLQYGDDSEAQPPGYRIDVLTTGRLLSEFGNELWIRVTRADGSPHSGPVRVSLHSGEFQGKRGSADAPVVLATGQTDAMGLLVVRGRLTSEVLRINVEVLAPAPVDAPPEDSPTSPSKAEPDSKSPDETPTPEPANVLAKRKIRFVSFAGAIRVVADPAAVAPKAEIEIAASALRSRIPIFVDVFDGRGRWVDTVDPPFVGGEPPRPWSLGADRDDLLQLEAYHFTHAAGEATAVARVQVTTLPSTNAATLTPLIEAHRHAVDLPRVDRTYKAEIERKYLDAISKLTLQGEELHRARAFLLGTLPLRVHGPPLRLATRQRDLDEMAKFQRRWTIGLRVFLLGGGGLFLIAMTVAMTRAHRAAAAATLAAIERLGDVEAGLEAAEDLARSRRSAFWRGVAVIAVMAGGLVLTTVMLESLLWVF